MAAMIREVRAMEAYRPMPIVNNEDDRPWRDVDQGWGEDGNNFAVAVRNYAGWGYFDFRQPEEHSLYNEGFQSVPVNWQISSERKRDFFDLLAQITGSPGTPIVDVVYHRVAGRAIVQIVGDLPAGSSGEIELLVNNRVVAEAPGGSVFMVEIDVPLSEHGVRARVRYMRGDREVVIESPLVMNPWWPYGGPPPE
jgi:hypothetical protein